MIPLRQLFFHKSDQRTDGGREETREQQMLYKPQVLGTVDKQQVIEEDPFAREIGVVKTIEEDTDGPDRDHQSEKAQDIVVHPAAGRKKDLFPF